MLERLKKIVGSKAQQNRQQFISGTVRPADTYGSSRAPQRQLKAIAHLRGYVYAATMLNARSIASQPLRLYAKVDTGSGRKAYSKGINRNVERYLKGDASVRPAKSVMSSTNGGGELVEIYDHPILDLLQDVSPFIDGYQFNVLRKIMLQATGNEYLHPIIGPLGYPIELHVLPSQLVRIQPTRDERMIDFYMFGHSPEEVRFEPDEVLHNKTPSPTDPLYGEGWVSAAQSSATLLESMDEYELKLFENQARPDWGIFLKDNLTESQWNRMVSYIDANLRGNHNSGRPYIFEGGSDARPLQFSPRDLSFSDGELRKVESIAAISGVPVSLLRANDPNLASAEVGFASYMRDTIHPYLVSDCEFLNQSLLPLFGELAEDMFLAYDNPVAEDEERNSRIYLSEVSAGVRSINEARSELGLDPVDDGEELRVNGVPLSLAGQAQPIGGDPFAFTTPAESSPTTQPEVEDEPDVDEPVEDATPQEAAVDTGKAAAQDAALNGAQIQQLLAITDKVNLGELSADAGFAIALAAFPGIPNERLRDIFQLTEGKAFSSKSVRAGSFVEWRTPKGEYLGQVERVQKEGEAEQVIGDSNEATADDPIAHVRVYVRQEDGTYTESDRTVAVSTSRLTSADSPDMAEKAVPAKVRDNLKEKVKEHNEEVGDAKGKRATLRMLTACYERGIGAYSTNPGSVRPTVSGAEQWAYARVNGLLHALRTGKFKRKPYDTDLLPKEHPLSSKGEKAELDIPVEGEDGKVTQYGDVFTTPEEAMERALQLGCGGIHEHSGEDFGHDGTVYMPCETHEEYERLLSEASKKYEDIDFSPPKDVQEEAERGLEWRREHGRGGTEVGVARARDLSNGTSVSPETIGRMRNYFSRHTDDKQAEGFDKGEEGYPSAGRIAWALWGGDAGERWSNSIYERMQAEDERGEKVTRRDGEPVEDCVARGIEKVMSEGYPRDQAIAIAYSQCGKKSYSVPFFKTCTGLEEGICKKSEGMEDWHPEQKAARILVEEVEDEETGKADEGVQREGEPVTPATQITRNVSKILRDQREKILKDLSRASGKSVSKKKLQRSDISRILAVIGGDTAALEQAIIGPLLAALDAGSKYAGEELGQAANQAIFEVVNKQAVEYAKSHAASLAKNLQESTIDSLRTVLSNSVSEGFGVEKTADAIMANDRLFTRGRATVIARTETARAFNEGNLEMMRNVPSVAGKKWLKAPRACKWCEQAASQTASGPIGVDKKFIVDIGTTKVRRVAVDSPPLHPNCRCGIRSVQRKIVDD